MQKPLELSIQDTRNRQFAEEIIMAKISKLEQLYSGIIGIRVFIHQPHKNHRKGNAHMIKIDIKMPDYRIIVNCESNYELPTLIHEAFEVAQRQVKNHAKHYHIKRKVSDSLKGDDHERN
jgi:translation initiation factor 2 alpha subunit (eIF-2alpha)